MKMTKRDSILLAVIALIAVVGGFYWFVAKPAKAELKTQRDALEQVRGESSDLRDTITRLSATTTSASARTSERLRLSKAIPETTETPGVVVQLQRLADRAGVELTSIKTNSYSDFGSIRGTEFEVRVSGRFFDVDDFLYRLHRQVSVDEKDRPIVGGRLFATTSVDLNLDQGEIANGTGGAPSGDDRVVGSIKVVAFSAVPGGAAAGTSSSTAPGTAVAAPTTSGAAPTTAAPTTGGTQ